RLDCSALGVSPNRKSLVSYTALAAPPIAASMMSGEGALGSTKGEAPEGAAAGAAAGGACGSGGVAARGVAPLLGAAAGAASWAMNALSTSSDIPLSCGAGGAVLSAWAWTLSSTF